jgi:hypothetical protein
MFNCKVSEEKSTDSAIVLYCKISHCLHAMHWLLSDMSFQSPHHSVDYVLSYGIPCIVVIF